jgi:hypothetical protein
VLCEPELIAFALSLPPTWEASLQAVSREHVLISYQLRSFRYIVLALGSVRAASAA